MLQHKRILFICPFFYDYHLSIKAKLEDFGAEVVLFGERPYDFSFTIMNNLQNHKTKDYQNRYYNKIFNKVKKKGFDFLFVIRGYCISENFIENVKRHNPGIITILYQWDSNNTNPYFKIIPLFDKVFSFDYSDSKINAQVKYLPLFFTNDIENLPKNEILYDFLCLGSFLPERFEAMNRLDSFCKENGFKIKLFLSINFLGFVKEFMKGRIRKTSFVSLRKLSRKEYLNLLSQSRIVCDISSVNQTGLSMRVIEALGANKKVLTTNTNIVMEGLNKESIEIIDINNISITKPFFHHENVNENYKKYSIDNWIKILFND